MEETEKLYLVIYCFVLANYAVVLKRITNKIERKIISVN